MKKSIICLSLIFGFLWSSAISFSQVSKSDIDKAIDIPSLKHPYLYFTEQEKPAILERIQKDEESYYIFEKLLAEANMWMAMPVDGNIPIQGKNTRAGWTEYDLDGKYSRYYTFKQEQRLLPGIPLPNDRRTKICYRAAGDIKLFNNLTG